MKEGNVMKYQKTLLLSASCFLLAFLCSIVWGYQKDGNLTERIAPHLLRFHIMANSNSPKDQQAKLQIKSLLLTKLEDCPADSKEEFCTYITDHRKDLESFVNDWLFSQGEHYRADITITRNYFPTKAYGNLVLPCGVYDTVLVTLGNGRGRNWWCVLYPRLCFIDSTHAVLPEESAARLKDLLPEEDFQAVMASSPKIHIRLKLLEILR